MMLVWMILAAVLVVALVLIVGWWALSCSVEVEEGEES